MMGEPLVVRDRDLAEAVFAVRYLFAEPIDTDDAVELLRDVFGEVWGWTDTELLMVLRAALVEH
jgi:hypothetical protein